MGTSKNASSGDKPGNRGFGAQSNRPTQEEALAPSAADQVTASERAWSSTGPMPPFPRAIRPAMRLDELSPDLPEVRAVLVRTKGREIEVGYERRVEPEQAHGLIGIRQFLRSWVLGVRERAGGQPW